MFGATTTNPLVEQLLASNPNPTQADVATFLGFIPSGEERDATATALVARGVSPVIVVAAMEALTAATHATWKRYATYAAAAVAGFHGYRRNNSIGWGAAWFTLGVLFPVFTTAIALAQGLGQPRKG